MSRRRRIALGVAVAAAVVYVLAAEPGGAHSPAEAADWWAAWHDDVRVAGGLTPELLAAAVEFVDRHETPAETDEDRREGAAPTVPVSAPSGEWAGLIAAHFPAPAVDTMTCLVWHESRGDPGAINPTSGAAGLLQIMPFWADHFGVARSALLEPTTNVRIARKVWDAQGYAAWSPWKRGECR